MAVFRDLCRRITGSIDKNFLGNEKDTTGGLKTLDIKSPVILSEFHQVDTGQIAGRIIQEHVFRTRVTGVNAPRIRAGMPAIDRRVVLYSWVPTIPGALSHPVQ